MSKTSRRSFLRQLSAAAVVLPPFGPVPLHRSLEPFSAQTGAGQGAIDLLVTGGRVIDPTQKLSAVRDIAVANGRIVEVAESITSARARQVIDARQKIVTAGIIDVHAHAFEGVAFSGIDPDVGGIQKGVTTFVDGGSAGAITFPGFRRYVIERATTDIYAWLSMSRIGMIVPNEFYLDPALVDTKAAIDTVEKNRDRILGLKVRFNGAHANLAADLETLKKSRQVADATALPMLVHWTIEPELLALLKPGDVLSHPFNRIPGRTIEAQSLDESGKVWPQILAARARGIFIDLGHGSHFQWKVAEQAMRQGFLPDTLSTDMTSAYGAPNGIVVDIPTTMSKFISLGMTLEQAVERATTIPGKILKYPRKIGTLQVGSAADITIMEMVKGPVEVMDSLEEKRTLPEKLVPRVTILGGRVVFGRV